MHLISKRLEFKVIDTFLNLLNEDIPGLSSGIRNNNHIVLSPQGWIIKSHDSPWKVSKADLILKTTF